MTNATASLNDKYEQSKGRVFMSGIQALVRLPLDMARRDQQSGRRSAGFISGYRGSPIGGFDAALWAAQDLLDEHRITFQPGLNEELAASAARGTQELAWFGKSDCQGIFAMWYGKHVGADRAMEALKLGNLEGSSSDGGVLAIAADDHGGKSSASAQGSEQTLAAALLPVLYPADAGEIIEYGLLGWEMSRFSGLYVALKTVTDTLDFSSTVDLPHAGRDIIQPEHPTAPPKGLNLRQFTGPLAQESCAVEWRIPAAQAFAKANRLDRIAIDSPDRALSIVTAGKAYKDVRQALEDLGLDDDACARRGIRLFKLGMIWPIEPEALKAFAARSREIFVIEEKRPFIEDQLASILYSLPANERPRLVGKRDLDGNVLLSSVGELSPALVREAIFARLEDAGLTDEDMRNRQKMWRSIADQAKSARPGEFIRPPYYCSGCPHNIGTKLPEGSNAMSAVGCHGLAAFMPERRTMMPMPMGGDGMPWVAAGPFVDQPHIFQNMGDGTFAHSGILSIRAAVAAKANMTFKILYNDAVAMTGGQPVEGMPSPSDICRQLLAENVAAVVMVAEAPEEMRGAQAPPDKIPVYHRDELDRVQREIREIEGVTALVYVQTCAAEKRRRRKRGTMPDPDRRVFINSAVCEGCGDCSAQANCLSILPVETEFGRKRKIDQSSCNKDYSCLKGFCPSFVTVEGARIANSASGATDRFDTMIAELPEPRVADCEQGYNLLIAGIGGTGVLTVGAVLGMAAHLDGESCTVLDQTGMAQKGGAVTSHIRIGPSNRPLYSARFDEGRADLIIGCDLVVTTGNDVLKTIRPGRTAAVLNLDVAPTGQFQTDREMRIDSKKLAAIVRARLDGGPDFAFPATQLATRLRGDSIATNLFMIGYCLQKGLLPVSLHALEDAIRLNGSFVEGNLKTLGLGRLAAADPALFERDAEAVDRLSTVEGVVESRTALLKDYQNDTYARVYRGFVEDLRERVSGIAGADEFVRVAALGLARVMAYKDEYEVGRMFSDPAFKAELSRQFDGPYKLYFHLAPPLLTSTDAATGRPAKKRFGSWMTHGFRLLARLKWLRGTALDPFGYTAERKAERALIGEYKSLLDQTAERLNPDNLSQAIVLADAVNEVRGYGPVKDAALKAYHEILPALREEFEQADSEANTRELA